MCQCGPTATGTPNTAGSSTEWSPARWYPPPTNATSASAYRSARIPTRSTTITGAEDVCSTCDSRTGRGRPTRAAACAMPARWSGLGSWGARTSRAVGTCASKSTKAGRITASSAGQVDPATMVNVLAGAMEAGERVARAVEALRSLGDAVVPRIPRHFDGRRASPQLLEAAAVLLADRADAFEGAVRGLRPAAGRPTEPRAVRRHRGRDEAQLHAALRRRQGQLGPHVELREDERGGPERLERAPHFSRAVERQVIRHIDRQAARQPLGRRGEKRIRELPVGGLGAHRLEHRLCLEALAHRRRVHPQERALGVAVRLCPGGQPVRHSPTRIEAAGQLLVEARGEGQGPLREPHAEPVYEGRTCPPHQRAPGAVLLR